MDNLGAPGSEDTGDMAGQEGSIPTTDMGNEGAGETTPNEAISRRGKKIITEQSNLFEQYLASLTGNTHTPKETKYERAKVYDSNSLLINEEFDKMIDALGKFVDDDIESDI
jgi:hypothetical protein